MSFVGIISLPGGNSSPAALISLESHQADERDTREMSSCLQVEKAQCGLRKYRGRSVIIIISLLTVAFAALDICSSGDI